MLLAKSRDMDLTAESPKPASSQTQDGMSPGNLGFYNKSFMLGALFMKKKKKTNYQFFHIFLIIEFTGFV